MLWLASSRRLRGAVCVAGLSACLSASPAFAQQSAPPSVVDAAPTAEARLLAQLFENVNFWSQKGQPETARSELDRVLILAPRDPDALALAARIAFQLGQFDAGNRYRNQLKLIAPNDARLAALDAEQPLTADQKQLLDEARKLSAAGRNDEAIEAYRQVFQHGVPDSLAVEYYRLMGTSSSEAFRQALDGLNQAADRWPGDMTFALAAAELQTYREGSRAAGIEALRGLSHVPATATAARAAWRQALLWEGEDAKTRDQITAYLAENPTDPTIEAKVKDIQDSVPDDGVIDRLRAYEAIAAGNTQAAEAGFLAALAHDPNDAEAMIMLSIIRRQQGRLPESDQLIAKALQIAPERRDEFVKNIGFDPATIDAQMAAARAGGGQGQSGDGAVAVRRAYAHVGVLTNRGDYAGAERELLRLMGPRPQAGSYVQLGYLQLRAGQLAASETSFRRALAASPRNVAALGGLAQVYTRQGDTARASQVYAQLGTTPGAQGMGQVRATALRTEAASAGNPADKARLYREAIAADPSSPWLKLEYSQFLFGSGDEEAARATMAGVASGPHPTSDAVQAALVWAQQHNEPARVEQLVADLPLKARTPQILDLQARSQITLDIDRAKAAGGSDAVQAALVGVAARPDPSGTRGQAVGQALIKLGRRSAVRDAVRVGLQSTPAPTQLQRLLYAGVLSQAGLNDDARVLLRQVTPAGLQPLQRTAYNGLADGLAIQHADQLNQQGKRADAFEALSPRLQADPDSPGVNLAVSRLYAADGKPQQALRIAESTLQRSPSDLDAMRATVDAALQAGEVARARQLTAQAVASQPDDPRAYLMQADVARFEGQNGVALTALRKARSLRQDQLNQAQ